HWRVGSNVVDDLDAAAKGGLLVGGVITFTTGPETVKPVSGQMPLAWPLYGLTIAGGIGGYTLSLSDVESGATHTMQLDANEVEPLAVELSRALSSGTGQVNVSAVIHRVTGRHLPRRGEW
ncbi:MAG: hypothetical protein M3443_03685, partial [Actinomycetota bacterium]|nr:hypothetical protein [Actinomycetota bacterium]